MSYLFFTRTIAWPLNVFGTNGSNKPVSLLDDEYQKKEGVDASPPLISNRDLASQTELSKNVDRTKSIVESDKFTTLPSPGVMSILGKHYLTREDLENMIQARFQQETPRDRIERLLWRE